MIRSFRDRDTEPIFSRGHSKKLPTDIQRVACRKLLQIDAASKLDTLRVPPGNRLEALRGERAGQHSIHIKDQWRCFVWMETRMRSRSSITIEASDPEKVRMPPVHPGEILLEDFMKPVGISQYRLAKALGVPPQRLHDLVHGRRAMTADTALRLARAFDMEAQFWMNLQTRYDLEVATDRFADRIAREVTPLAS